MSDDETARNPEDDRVIALLERTLAAHAESASAPPDLSVRARTRRRRQVARRTAAVGAAALGVAAAITVPMVLTGAGADANPEPINTLAVAPVDGGVLPVEAPADGWRWESYGGIQLQVPAGWQTGGTHQPWCARQDGDPAPVPYVSRPGATLAIGCGPEPVEQWVSYVEFGSSNVPGRVQLQGDWVSETLDEAGVSVTVRADDPGLLERILSSAAPVTDVDAVGCPTDYAVTQSLDARPTTGSLEPGQVGQDGAVCQYALLAGTTSGKPLIASHRMSEGQVATFADALAAAPIGGGPDRPGDCVPEVRRGDDALLVRLSTTDGLRDVIVWYSGCITGADDGVTLHTLTAELLSPLFNGAVVPSSFNESVAPLLD